MSTVRDLFDEDLNDRIVRGVRRRISDLNATTVQEAGLRDASDPAWIGLTFSFHWPARKLMPFVSDFEDLKRELERA